MKNKIQKFEAEIDRHETQLFGVALFNQSIALLYKNDPATLEITKFHYDQIMERGNKALHNARILLGQVKIGAKLEDDLDHFSFPPIEGQDDLDEMTTRANIMVKTYHELFPAKSREEASKLSDEDLMILIQKSADML